MADAVIDPSYGFINYSNIKNDELLNEMLLSITDKNDFCYIFAAVLRKVK